MIDAVASSPTDPQSGQPKRKPRYQAMLLASIPFACGIVIDSVGDFPANWYLVSTVSTIVAWFIVFSRMKRRNDRAALVASLLLMLSLASMGAYWHHGRWNWHGPNQIGSFTQAIGQPCYLRGRLLREPRKTIYTDLDEEQDPLQSAERTRLQLRVASIRHGRDWKAATGLIDVIVHADLDHVRAGDELCIAGKLFGVDGPTNPGQFDFQNYLRTRGRFATVHVYYPESVTVSQPATLWTGAALLSSLRRKLNEITWRFVDADEAGFASAILLGNREQLTPDRRTAFLETGTAHLLAISGLHVGILAASIFVLFRIGFLSRQKCLIATILFVIFYMWLVEFRPTVTRAAILVTLYCVGRLLGQRGYSFNLLAISAWIVLLLNPSDLFGVGPQLSFLAVATLSFGKSWIWWPATPDPIQRLIANSRPWYLQWINHLGQSTRAAALGSALIWLCAAPLVAWHFHLVAPIGLVLNPLLLFPIACGLYAGAATLLLGWISDWPARVCGWLCEQSLGAIEAVIQAGQGVPLSHFWTAGPPLVSLALFYVALLALVVYPATRLPDRWIACLGTVWLVFGWLVPAQLASDRNGKDCVGLVCTFVDVGHGTSVLTQFPDGRNLLYDCGSFGSSRYGVQSISSVLWSERIIHLDAIVLSHADIDHFNAMSGLSERFSIGSVYLSPQMLSSDAPAVVQTLAGLRNRGIRIKPILSGDQLGGSDKFSIDVLGPITEEEGSTDNSDSVVLQIRCAGRSVLLPGDIEAEGLEELLSRRSQPCDILMAAHHGSRNSDPDRFVKWADPEIVVISGGRNRVDDQVAQEIIQSGRRMFRTDQDGAVRLTLSPDSIDVECCSNGRWVAQK